MDLLTAMKISSSGLSAQRTRMNVVSSNLANVNTTRTPEGGPYRRKQVMMGAVPVEQNGFQKVLSSEISEPKVLGIEEDQSEFQRVYDPSHPDADDKGYVYLPNVNVMKEMVDMLSATRAYEANAAVIGSVKDMAQKAIDIGNR
ncbi:MAG: flagellar basal body rod protein FlgC [Nitrospinota bacterium]|nr:flagellar basal body rod protein FlgC [Nitrospinota bacterium]